MRRNGQSKEDIISNLQELGIPEPEKYYERVISEEGKGILSEGNKDESISEPEFESILNEAERDSEKGGDLFGSGGKGGKESNESAKRGSYTENERKYETSKGGAIALEGSEHEGKEVLKSETRSLFENKGGNALFNPEPSTAEKQRAQQAVEGIPKLEITSIRDGEEKVSDIEEMLGKKQAPPQIMKSMPQMSLAHLDEVERKLDDLISVTKAVYEIDKKILEANRELILKLKTQKT